MGNEQRDEWVRLMTELAALDRNEYRAVRAEAWDRIQRAHAAQTPEERARWRRNAS